MQSYLNDSKPDSNITNFKLKENVIQTLKNRFVTYGYQQIQTPAFETYDLYTTVTGTINQDDMIKVIDRSGRILVLRPDITIPITQKVASYSTAPSEELRYFYVLDVFRQTFNQQNDYERTQAGIEFFGNSSTDADAEVIALAAHTLIDLNVNRFTIELGHAAFFKELLQMVAITTEERHQLKEFIQAKNIPGLNDFLDHLDIQESIKQLFKEIPLLYGPLKPVIEKAKRLSLTEKMVKTLNRLEEIYDNLVAYGYEQNIILDLGLINHMEYYSDVIFQGYIENVGKPILSGGRYDKLANQFQASIPAIGFAFDIDLLVDYPSEKSMATQVDVAIQYNQKKKGKAIQLAQALRNQNYSVSTITSELNGNSKCTIILQHDTYTLTYNGATYELKTSKEILKFIKELEGGN